MTQLDLFGAAPTPTPPPVPIVTKPAEQLPPLDGGDEMDEALRTLTQCSIEWIIPREVSLLAAMKLCEFHYLKSEIRKAEFQMTEPVQELRKLKCIAVRYEGKTVRVRVNRGVVLELARLTDLKLQTWSAVENGDARRLDMKEMLT